MLSPEDYYKDLSMKNLPNEVWEPVYLPKYNSKYEVSNMGRVKSVSHYVTYHYKHCNKSRLYKGKILRQEFNGRNRHGRTGHGYLFVRLYPGCHYVYVHQLVLRTFKHGQHTKEQIQVNHINEIKTDNRLSNLNYMTPKENANYGHRNEKVALPQQKPVVMYIKNYLIYCPSLTLGAKFICGYFDMSIKLNYRNIRTDLWHVVSPTKSNCVSVYGFHAEYDKDR